ncbi:hypothetical protein [Sphingopyxis granuli]|uniref:hypothetical protein n=1 Tax=Sphingopyxis granuli TaxID=267128 RepID=UPI00301B9D51
MIEHLELGRSAYFYRRKKALSATAITALFKKLHDDARNPKRSVFKLVREDAEDCVYSALSFSFERPPAFLAATANVKRRSKGTPDRRRRGTPFSDNMMLVC